jgi:hypothetical protein
MDSVTVTSPAVEERGLGKSFRPQGGRRSARKRALHSIELRLDAGELVAIVGLNGSGKSTLIRVLATLTTPDQGSVRVFGHDVVADSAAVRRLINRVSVEASFFKEMSAWENLSYAGRLYGRHGGEVRAQAMAVLERLGLPKSAVDRPMKQLRWCWPRPPSRCSAWGSSRRSCPCSPPRRASRWRSRCRACCCLSAGCTTRSRSCRCGCEPSATPRR